MRLSSALHILGRMLVLGLVLAGPGPVVSAQSEPSPSGPSQSKPSPAPSSPAQTNPWGANYFPNVPVVDQDGRTLNFYDDVIKGKMVVVSFIYTSCPDICPLTTARLSLACAR